MSDPGNGRCDDLLALCHAHKQSSAHGAKEAPS
jgi:hypothetical protein